MKPCKTVADETARKRPGEASRGFVSDGTGADHRPEASDGETGWGDGMGSVREAA